MKERISKLLLLSLLVFATSCTSLNETDKVKSAMESIDVSEKKLKHNLTLIVTSDIHAGVEDNWSLAGVYEKRKEYESKGDYTLLIDDGDLLQGAFLSSASKGMDLIDLANTAGYDIMTFGNHEFDYGMDNFFKISSKLNNPYISCNFNKNGELIFKPYVIKEFDGVKFAFIGINTPDCITTSNPKHFQDSEGNFIYSFYQGENGETLYNKVQESIDNAKKDGADYVVAVAHVGQKEATGPYKYTDIISHTSGFDVFLDGHSHDTDQVNMKDKDGHMVFRMGVGTKLSCIGVVTFTTTGTIEHELLTFENNKQDVETIKYDNVVNELVKKINDKLGNTMMEPIGTTDYTLCIFDPEATDSAGNPIRIIRRMETNLGDLVADAYKERLGADCAMENSGGIRVNIEKGEIVMSDVYRVKPFEDIICLIEATGQQISDALEWGCHATPAESGGFLQVSGITFELDTSIENHCKIDENGMCAGIEGKRRVKNIKVNGSNIELERKYKLAVPLYIAVNNGDGYTAFDGCKVLEEEVKVDYALVADYIKENLGGKIPEMYEDPYGNGRIQIP